MRNSLIGLATWLLSLVSVITFAIAVLGSISLFTFLTLPLEFTLSGEILSLTMWLLSSTYVMRQHLYRAKQSIAAKVVTQEIAGLIVEPEDYVVAKMEMPSFWRLLRRNAVVATFFVPLALSLTYIAWTLLRIIIHLSFLLFSPFLFALLCGWLFGVLTSWYRLAQMVDNNIFHTFFRLSQKPRIQ